MEVRDVEPHRDVDRELDDAPLTRQEYAEYRFRLVQATRIIWFLTGVLEALIGMRILLKLLGANPEAGFAQFVYGLTGLFLAPFQFLLPEPSTGGAVLETSSFVAMLFYALLAWGVVRAIWITFDRPPPPREPYP